MHLRLWSPELKFGPTNHVQGPGAFDGPARGSYPGYPPLVCHADRLTYFSYRLSILISLLKPRFWDNSEICLLYIHKLPDGWVTIKYASLIGMNFVIKHRHLTNK